jgi:hypothetical protein
VTSDDFLGEIKRPKKREFGNAVAQVTSQDVNRAAGGNAGRHGKRYQMTVRLEGDAALDILAEIRQWANELNTYQDDIKRWCFMRGLEALREGERPEVEQETVKRKLR